MTFLRIAISFRCAVVVKSKYCPSVGGQITNSKKSPIGLSKIMYYLKYDKNAINTFLCLRSGNVARNR
jgi:hypothetical protein